MAPISKIPICVSGAITPGVIILFVASTTTSPFRDLVETSKIVSPSIRISPTNGSSFSPVWISPPFITIV